MVPHYHDVAGNKIQMQAAGGIRNKQNRCSQEFHHAHRERYLLHRITFIIMEPALHRNYILPSQDPQNQFAAVRFDRRKRKARYFLVWDDRHLLNSLREFSEPRSKDYGHFRFYPAL